MAKDGTVDERAAVEWDTEVAALVGPRFAMLEQKLGVRLSPMERIIWLDGLHVGVDLASEIWRTSAQEIEDAH